MQVYFSVNFSYRGEYWSVWMLIQYFGDFIYLKWEAGAISLSCLTLASVSLIISSLQVSWGNSKDGFGPVGRQATSSREHLHISTVTDSHERRRAAVARATEELCSEIRIKR